MIWSTLISFSILVIWHIPMGTSLSGISSLLRSNPLHPLFHTWLEGKYYSCSCFRNLFLQCSVSCFLPRSRKKHIVSSYVEQHSWSVKISDFVGLQWKPWTWLAGFWIVLWHYGFRWGMRCTGWDNFLCSCWEQSQILVSESSLIPLFFGLIT